LLAFIPPPATVTAQASKAEFKLKLLGINRTLDPWKLYLVAVPLFVMMGEILIHSRLSERLYHVLSHWLAPLPGGLLHSNIAFCAVFGAISGDGGRSGEG
jgi:TRAP-type mannitol/chloroaromatic compound transport system permease large subunit